MKRLTRDEIDIRLQSSGIIMIGQYINANTKTLFLCPKCNKNFETKPSKILNDGTTSCLCYRSLKGQRRSDWKGYNDMPKNFTYRCRYGAKKRGIDFLVTNQDIYNQYLAQNKKCFYSGKDLLFDSTKNIQDASIDRLNNNEGYNINNIIICHKKINRLKWIFSYGYFLKLCDVIVNPIYTYNDIIITDKPKLWTGVGNLSYGLYARYKANAEKRNLNFDVDIDFLWSLYLEQKGSCKVSGLPIIFPKKAKNRIDGTASLDRINCNIGYRVGNLQWVHKDINQMRSNLSIEELKYWCNLVINNKDI